MIKHRSKCSVDGCEKRSDSKGFCPLHYGRWKRTGDPLLTTIAPGGMSVEGRFWRRVNKTNACWVWTGAVSDKGYGSFGIGGKTTSTHRFSYELAYGPIPQGMFVCHRCDNPPCCRPDHLFLDTAKGNARDMVAKGRARNRPFAGDEHWTHINPSRRTRGESCGGAKLTRVSVIAIRARRAEGEPLANIAKDYGISESTVSRIALRKLWAHILPVSELEGIE